MPIRGTPEGFEPVPPQAAAPEGFEPVTPEGFEPVQPINPNPPAFQKRVIQGDEIRKHVEELSKERGSLDPEIVKQAKEAWGRIAGGYQDSHGDDFWTRMFGVPKMALGAFQAATLPFNVPVAKVGQAVEAGTGGLLTQENVEQALMGLAAKVPRISPAGSHWDDLVGGAKVRPDAEALAGQTAEKVSPVVPAGGADQSVLHSGPDGQVSARVVGQYPPAPADFVNAATNAGAPEAKLRTYWEVDGLHPAEAVERAQQNQFWANDLSAAKAPPVVIPAKPTPGYIRDLEDRLYRLKTSHTADQGEFLNKVGDIKGTDQATREAWYRYGEGHPEHGMTPEQGAKYDEVMGPLKREEAQLYDEAAKTEMNVEELNPNYMHRMVVGKTPEIDRLLGEGQELPFYNGPGLTKPSSLQARKMYAIESPTGERRVVSVEGGKLSEPKEGGKLLYETKEDLRPGNEVLLDGQTWELKQALTDEIEAATDLRYYKDAWVNTVDNILKLRAFNRNVYEAQLIRSSDEYAQYAMSRNSQAPIPEGWKLPEHPLFRNDVMEPKLADAINDAWSRAPSEGIVAAMEKINRFAVRSLFWTPFPHAHNAAVHWIGARSWDWVTPAGLKSLTIDGMTAIREVAMQGPEYQRLLREGSGLIYGGVANREFYAQMLQKAGTEFQRVNPEEFGAIAKIVGMKPVELVASFYNASARALWAMSDVFMMQRVLELERKGMATKAAITEAEKFIPNYRLPSEILGRRDIAEIYGNPNLFMFSRYHYGILKGLANIAKDLAVGDAKHRFDAVGHIVALGTLQMLLYPAFTAALRQVTGEEKLKLPSAGPLRLLAPGTEAAVNATPDLWPQWVKDYYHNDTTLMQQLYNLAPVAPGLKLLGEGYTNIDLFSGRKIVEPGVGRRIMEGDTGAMRAGAAQEAEHMTQTLVQPYSLFKDAWKNDKNLGQVTLEHAFGMSNKTEAQERSKEKAFKYQDKAAKQRAKKPTGPIESLGQ